MAAQCEIWLGAVISKRSIRCWIRDHHGGGGPGYNLGATIYPDTPVGRVSIAVFVNSSCEPRADDCEATLIARLLDQGVERRGVGRCRGDLSHPRTVGPVSPPDARAQHVCFG